MSSSAPRTPCAAGTRRFEVIFEEAGSKSRLQELDQQASHPDLYKDPARAQQIKDTVRQDWAANAVGWRKWYPKLAHETRAATEVIQPEATDNGYLAEALKTLRSHGF
jgi:hypothetical protein